MNSKIILISVLRSVSVAMLISGLSAWGQDGPGKNAASAIGSPNHWVVLGRELSLQDETGNKKQSITLESKPRADNPRQPARETRAIVSKDGRTAFVIEHDWNADSETSSNSIRCLDSYGNLKWKRGGLDMNHFRTSDDGQFALLLVSSHDGCSSVEDTTCTKSAEVVDGSGNEHFMLGPFAHITGYVLSHNGQFGWIRTSGHGDKTYIFFNTAKGTTIKKRVNEIPGGPDLSEDGIVKFVKNVYDYKAPPEPSGEPKISKVDVLGQLDLR